MVIIWVVFNAHSKEQGLENSDVASSYQSCHLPLLHQLLRHGGV